MQGTYQREKNAFSQQTEEQAAQLLPDCFKRRANFARWNPDRRKKRGIGWALLHQPGLASRQGQNDAGASVFAGKQINGFDREEGLRIFNRGQAEEQRPLSVRRERPAHPGHFGIGAGGMRVFYAARGIKVDGVNAVADGVGYRVIVFVTEHQIVNRGVVGRSVKGAMINVEGFKLLVHGDSENLFGKDGSRTRVALPQRIIIPPIWSGTWWNT